MNTRSYARDLKKSIDINRYSKLIKSLGNQLNDRKNRFDKADIIEQSLEVYSDHRLMWVDDVGRDHHDTATGLDLEFKYINNGLFTKTGKQKSIVKVKVKNSLGANKGITIVNPADFYLIGQEDSIAIISFKDLKPYLISISDGIEAQIPFEELEFIFEPHEVQVNSLVNVIYKEEKRNMQRSLIESIK
jgi:hypothetical protein